MRRTRLARQGGNNGEANKLAPEDRAAHDWYRFVLSFPPHLVRTYLQRFGVNPQQRVLDPFCGTGTTIVECRKLGIPSVGIEANPMACFASQTKVDWTPHPDGLFEHASRLAEITSARMRIDGLDDDRGFPLFQENRPGSFQTDRSLRRLNAMTGKLLLADSISPVPLHKTLVLLECLQEYAAEQYLAHERLALAKALVYSIGNLHFGPEVGVGTPKTDAPVVSAWLQGVRTVADDLRILRSCRNVPVVVHHADARQLAQHIEPGSIDVVITSPPYPNEKDYTRTTRLESVLLGFIRDKSDLRRLKRSLVRSNTRGVYKGDTDDAWVSKNSNIQKVARAIEARRMELGKTSGFERLYPKVTKLYFGGMARHLEQLRIVLRPGAQLAYVVGDQASYLRIMIRTGQLLAEIAQNLGYELIGIDLFRTRLATATKEQLREEVVLLRWPGG